MYWLKKWNQVRDLRMEWSPSQLLARSIYPPLSAGVWPDLVQTSFRMEGHGPAAALGRVFVSEARTFEVCALVFRRTPARGRRSSEILLWISFRTRKVNAVSSTASYFQLPK